MPRLIGSACCAVAMAMSSPAFAASDEAVNQLKAGQIESVSRTVAIESYQRAYTKNAHLWRAQLILEECGDVQLAKELAKKDDTSGILGISSYGIAAAVSYEHDHPAGPKPDYRLVNFMLNGLKDGYLSGVGETFFNVVAHTPELRREHCQIVRRQAKEILEGRAQ